MNLILPSHRSRWIALMLAPFLLSFDGFSQSSANTLTFHAYLFYNKQAVFRKDILAKDGPTLGNILTDSTSTFVVVEVRPETGQPLPGKSQIRLVATESGTSALPASDTKRPPQRNKLILDKVTRIGPASDTGVTDAGFLVAIHGVLNHAESFYRDINTAPQTAVLGFACYE